MFLGIKMTPQGPGKKPVPSVFYCGLDPASLRAKHAELVKNNEDDSRFYLIQHPMMVPMQTVPTSSEEHPDVLKAQEHRKAIAEGEAVQNEKLKVKKLEPLPLIDPAVRRGELGRLKLKELQAVVERIKATGQDIEPAGDTKAELVDAILKSEGVHVPAEEETINAPAA